MTFDNAQALAGSSVPEAQHAVISTADDVLAIGAEGHALNPYFIAFKHTQALACGRIPKAQRVVKAATNNMLPVGADG